MQLNIDTWSATIKTWHADNNAYYSVAYLDGGESTDASIRGRKGKGLFSTATQWARYMLARTTVLFTGPAIRKRVRW